ncbi:MAG: triose-phosphate isomerase [bacterium]
MRKLIIAGNWKMNKGAAADAVKLAKGIAAEIGSVTAVDAVFCPPFTSLRAVVDCVAGTKITVGAQNMYHEESGAYTGEISPLDLLDCGCRYVIIGHSERRTIFKESNGFINKKVACALAHGLIPIMCIGETEQERMENRTEAVVEDHLKGGLAGLSAEQVKTIVLAYEPVWAIGTGKTASPEDAQAVHRFCRDWLAANYDQATADAVRIQYGGSMKAENARDLLTQPDIDGGLVGGAGLKVESFVGIIRNSGAL